jgi:hypothetical protein
VDEPSSRSLFCFIFIELRFLYAAPHRRLLLSTAVSPAQCLEEGEDPDRYRFGFGLTGRARGLASVFFSLLPMPEPRGPAQLSLCVRPRLKKSYLGFAILEIVSRCQIRFKIPRVI